MKNFFVKNAKFFVAFVIFFSLPSNFFSYMVKYKEDFYKLYHIHYQQYPDDCIENIYWLEKAVQADFANPMYAQAKIETKDQWEKYRFLFMMHINLKLCEQHLRLARIYDKKVANFYDAPWKDCYLENLSKAETLYQTALVYWQEAKLWAEKSNVKKFRFLTLTDLQFWEDERERIASGELNLQKNINRELDRVKNVQKDFQEMKKEY